jgi:hypothetical protein
MKRQKGKDGKMKDSETERGRDGEIHMERQRGVETCIWRDGEKGRKRD